MIHPKKLLHIDSITLKSQLEEGKIRVIIVDGIKQEAWITEAPEHGKKRSSKQERAILPVWNLKSATN